MELKVADEIANVSHQKPHVVLLGAGASRAAFPNGDAYGRRLPVMADFVEVLGLRPMLDSAGISWKGNNFEDIYSGLARTGHPIHKNIEEVIQTYFSSLKLPDHVTSYDRLVLSLRPKDVIATFNWDPFLIQAVRRNGLRPDHVKLAFLHGNVLQGYCAKDNLHGIRGSTCSLCGRALAAVPLLYPIGEKDYDNTPAIKSAWDLVRQAFRDAFMVTVFGYGAPASDRSAVDLLKNSWGNVEDRQFEQFELIDIRAEEDLRESWGEFIHTHHYEVHYTFEDSWIRNHPRRTGEAFWNQYMMAAFIEPNPVPALTDLVSLHAWFEPLIAIERAAEAMSS
jgi:hypothetical protein